MAYKSKKFGKRNTPSGGHRHFDKEGWKASAALKNVQTPKAEKKA